MTLHGKRIDATTGVSGRTESKLTQAESELNIKVEEITEKKQSKAKASTEKMPNRAENTLTSPAEREAYVCKPNQFKILFFNSRLIA